MYRVRAARVSTYAGAMVKRRFGGLEYGTRNVGLVEIVNLHGSNRQFPDPAIAGRSFTSSEGIGDGITFKRLKMPELLDSSWKNPATITFSSGLSDTEEDDACTSQ